MDKKKISKKQKYKLQKPAGKIVNFNNYRKYSDRFYDIINKLSKD